MLILHLALLSHIAVNLCFSDLRTIFTLLDDDDNVDDDVDDDDNGDDENVDDDVDDDNDRQA